MPNSYSRRAREVPGAATPGVPGVAPAAAGGHAAVAPVDAPFAVAPAGGGRPPPRRGPRRPGRRSSRRGCRGCPPGLPGPSAASSAWGTAEKKRSISPGPTQRWCGRRRCSRGRSSRRRRLRMAASRSPKAASPSSSYQASFTAQRGLPVRRRPGPGSGRVSRRPGARTGAKPRVLPGAQPGYSRARSPGYSRARRRGCGRAAAAPRELPEQALILAQEGQTLPTPLEQGPRPGGPGPPHPWVPGAGSAALPAGRNPRGPARTR